jgi:hypothetical protein
MPPTDTATLRIALNEPTAQDFPLWTPRTLAPGTTLSGVAPRANLVSLKVLDNNSKTLSSVIIEALDYVREVNSYGRELQIHGVNLSLGCGWLPKDYAAVKARYAVSWICWSAPVSSPWSAPATPVRAAKGPA